MTALDAKTEALLEAEAVDWSREVCACGHPRRMHNRSDADCRGITHRVVPPPGLPPAELTDPGDFMAFPSNWPPAETWPVQEQRCGCTSFDLWEPEPDDA